MKKSRKLFHFLAALVFLLLGVAECQEKTREAYEQMSYDQIRSRLTDLAQKFPSVMLLENSKSKVGVPYLVDCDDKGNKCVLDIVTITDFKTSSENKVQVYVSGSLQGNERLGPVITVNLIEYLVSNFKKDVTITYLLQTREIIITPMTNAYGYAKKTLKELT